MEALEIKSVTKKYPKFTLDNVSFNIPQGCIMGLIGENGAGKSTIFKAVLDLINKDNGEILFYGQKLDRNAVELKEDIGVVFDSLHYYESLKVEQVEKINGLAYKNWSSDDFYKYCKAFKIEPGMKLKELSKGMKMKVEIAVALSHKAKFLILDEPTSGLDPVARDEILELFLDFMQDETHSILFSSHITSDIEKIADYITFIHEGKIVFSKTKDELMYEYRIVNCGKSDFIEMINEDGAIYRKMDYQYKVLLPHGKVGEEKYKSCVFERATLDEIMLMYIKGERS